MIKYCIALIVLVFSSIASVNAISAGNYTCPHDLGSLIVERDVDQSVMYVDFKYGGFQVIFDKADLISEYKHSTKESLLATLRKNNEVLGGEIPTEEALDHMVQESLEVHLEYHFRPTEQELEDILASFDEMFPHIKLVCAES